MKELKVGERVKLTYEGKRGTAKVLTLDKGYAELEKAGGGPGTTFVFWRPVSELTSTKLAA